jgi:hypothetical protein
MDEEYCWTVAWDNALTAMGGTVTLSSKRFFCGQAAAIESVREAWQMRDWCATQ